MLNNFYVLTKCHFQKQIICYNVTKFVDKLSRVIEYKTDEYEMPIFCILIKDLYSWLYECYTLRIFSIVFKENMTKLEKGI